MTDMNIPIDQLLPTPYSMHSIKNFVNGLDILQYRIRKVLSFEIYKVHQSSANQPVYYIIKQVVINITLVQQYSI